MLRNQLDSPDIYGTRILKVTRHVRVLPSDWPMHEQFLCKCCIDITLLFPVCFPVSHFVAEGKGEKWNRTEYDTQLGNYAYKMIQHTVSFLKRNLNISSCFRNVCFETHLILAKKLTQCAWRRMLQLSEEDMQFYTLHPGFWFNLQLTRSKLLNEHTDRSDKRPSEFVSIKYILLFHAWKSLGWFNPEIFP